MGTPEGQPGTLILCPYPVHHCTGIQDGQQMLLGITGWQCTDAS